MIHMLPDPILALGDAMSALLANLSGYMVLGLLWCLLAYRERRQ